MPTYLCHGFRWHRRDLRIFVVVNDLEDVAPDWIIGPTSSTLILDQFAESFDFLPKMPESAAATDNGSDAKPLNGQNPSTNNKKKTNAGIHHDDDFDVPPSQVPAADDSVLCHEWSPVKLLEEHDPLETTSPARPYAYVADHVVRIDLSADIAGEMAKYEKQAGRGGAPWFAQLRDKVQQAEEIKWYIVVCGDELRDYPDDDDDDEDDDSARDETSVREDTEDDYNRRVATMTATSESCADSAPTTGGRPSRDNLKVGRVTNSQDYSHMKPPPIPKDDPPREGQKGHTRRPSLRHKLSRASGLRRLFTTKESQV
ncbi:hypothetical protein K4F52_006351 [Lecanicillium sp. MT-2017a]|nr:hypothetical protein K4F52_006351 [Lecanicillium sp. MT-2017a]